MLNKNYIYILFLFILIACKKELPPSMPGIINGPLNFCPNDSNISYTIEPLENTTYYLWTVPDDSKIISGQGSTSIKVHFGNKSGEICVKSNNNNHQSEPSCIEVSQGGLANTWCRELNFLGDGRSLAVGFSIGNKGYIGTGLGINQYKDFWEYDPAFNTWTQKANFAGGERMNAVGFAIGDKGYIGTGYDAVNYFKDFWEYDPALDTWSEKANFPDVAGRAFCFSLTIGGKGYIGSGTNYSNDPRLDFYEYDPTNNIWTQKDSLPSPFLVASSFTIGNKGYMGLGTDGNQTLDKFFEFDPVLNKWTRKADFAGGPRYNAVGFAIGDKGYIGTGEYNNNLFNDFWEYDPNNTSNGFDTNNNPLGKWNQKTSFPGAIRKSAVGFTINKKGYIGTGAPDTGPLFIDFWVYGQ